MFPGSRFTAPSTYAQESRFTLPQSRGWQTSLLTDTVLRNNKYAAGIMQKSHPTGWWAQVKSLFLRDSLGRTLTDRRVQALGPSGTI